MADSSTPFMDERQRLKMEWQRLVEEHRDIDSAILALEQLGVNNQLQIQRMKKRKLIIKDRLNVLSNQMTPDIIA